MHKKFFKFNFRAAKRLFKLRLRPTYCQQSHAITQATVHHLCVTALCGKGHAAANVDVNKTGFKSRDMESDRAVERVLAVKGQQQKELIGNLLEDEKYQR